MKTKGLLLLASLAMMIMFTGVAAAEGPVKEVYPQGTSEQSGTADWASLEGSRSKPEAAKPKSTKAAKTFLPTSPRGRSPSASPPAE